MVRRLVPLLALVAACDRLPDLTFSETATHPHAAFLSVGGSGPEDVWIVGARPSPTAGPVLLHSDGANWTELPTGQLHDLWWVHSFGDGEAMAAGAGATVLRINGEQIERLQTPGFAGQTVFGLWGSSPDDVWAVGGFAGRAGFAWRWDGTAWRDEPLPADLPRSSTGEIPGLFKVWGRSADDVWLVGGLGTVLHWDGTALSVVESGTTEQLFTVNGDDEQIVAVGGGSAGVVIRGGLDGFEDDTPAGAPLLQAVDVEDGVVYVAGADGRAWRKGRKGEWAALDLGFSEDPQSVHALWADGEGGVWGAGGGVLSPELDAGVACTTSVDLAAWEPEEIVPPTPACPEAAIDPAPNGSIARRWHEQLLNSIRRDIPHPPKHARNLHHFSVAVYDAWAAYQDVAEPVLYTTAETAADPDAAREIAISYAAYRVLKHRYANAIGAAVSLDCYDKFMGELGLDPTVTSTDGSDPAAVGNRIGQLVIDTYLNDGANETANYADTTGWTPGNPVSVVDVPGTNVTNPDEWQQLNLGLAETQNGIVLESTVQPYIGPHWREVEPFAMERNEATGLYSDPGSYPKISDEEMVDWVVEVIVKTAELDHLDGVTVDSSPASTGNNALGTNDGEGYALNPVTGQPYTAQPVPRGDFARVIAELWADGPQSETPPGHWSKLANDVSDDLAAAGEPLRPYGGDEVDRLAWDVGMYLVVTGATHDAAIAAWELKRDSLGPRPITLIRWMAQNGQRSDESLPSYSPDGLPLVDGTIELITEASSAPGERHYHLRWYVGEVAVWSWPGEPGLRSTEFTPFQWMRAKDWIPYQRRTFVTPAFPGFISGHSTFSRAAAEALTAYTDSPWFPGGLGEYVLPHNEYLIFEDGPSQDVHLQWASYYDAADQAGQSRLWGGIHIWPDDRMGRIVGSQVGLSAVDKARDLWSSDR
jgi:hypothetical protein